MELSDFERLIENILPNQEDLTEIEKFNHYQVRHVNSSTEHIIRIADRIDDVNCNTEGMPAIIVLKDYRGIGKHTMLDGNHRYKAVKKSCATKYPVKYVFKCDWSRLTELELYELGLRLNKVSETPRLEINKTDIYQFMFTYISENKTDAGLKEKLQAMGLTTREASARLREGKKYMEQNAYLESLGKDIVWINWSDPTMSERYRKEIDKRKARDTLVFPASSKNFSYNPLIPKIIDDKPKNVIVLLHHPDFAAERDWKRNWRDKHERWMEVLGYKLGFISSWDFLPKYEHNSLK